MKTKLLVLLMALVLVVAAFVSCGEDTPTVDPNKPDNTPDPLPPDVPQYNYSWNKTDIKMELTNNSNSDELSSGCQRYYAGTAANAFDPIDEAIRQRNLWAAQAANVTLDPSYVGNTSEYSWGQNITRIAQQAITENSANPDIYVNFAYDLTCAQLRGAFANLKSESYASGNFFRFNESDYDPTSDDYFDAEAGEGYFYQYMQSLSLSDDKIYCLASNYCTDLVRAFLVVPVNISMLNAIQATDSWTGDMVDFNDFYNLVWRDENKVTQNSKYAEGWTYDVLAHYSQKVYSNKNLNGNDKLGDVVGFIAGRTSGLVSSGFLYTSDVQIITKTSNGDGSYTFAYPTNNTKLEAFGTAITELFSGSATTGVITVGEEDDVKTYDPTCNGSELQMVRNKFARNEVLFGGIIAVGSLEDTVYQNMRVDGEGFGILPVPLYTNEGEYLTLVHNLARIVAIAKASPKFSQCSAYLDFVSRESADILDTYYNDILSAAAGGVAASQNNKMLTYIRNHVRDCFDKTFEDAVANKYEAEVGSAAATNSKWHEILGNKNGFIYSSFAKDYAEQIPQKQKNLDDVVKEWNNSN